MSALATIRPDDWNLPLFLHVLAAFVLVGALVMAASFLFAARRRDGSPELGRLGFRSLLIVALPAFIVNRITAQWLLDEEGLEDADAPWIDVGFISTDVGVLALLRATIATGLVVRRAGQAPGDGRGEAAITLAAWLVGLLIVFYAVVIWLMATKPV